MAKPANMEHSNRVTKLLPMAALGGVWIANVKDCISLCGKFVLTTY